eukprot:SAG31_NODE_89_length_26711_cov_24.949459_16_plen_170_part_00
MLVRISKDTIRTELAIHDSKELMNKFCAATKTATLKDFCCGTTLCAITHSAETWDSTHEVIQLLARPEPRASLEHEPAPTSDPTHPTTTAVEASRLAGSPRRCWFQVDTAIATKFDRMSMHAKALHRVRYATTDEDGRCCPTCARHSGHYRTIKQEYHHLLPDECAESR